MAQAPTYIKPMTERLEESVLTVDDPAQQVHRSTEAVEAVERYRLRWQVADQSSPLGPEPEPGTREATEYDLLVRLYGEELMPEPREESQGEERAQGAECDERERQDQRTAHAHQAAPQEHRRVVAERAVLLGEGHAQDFVLQLAS